MAVGINSHACAMGRRIKEPKIERCSHYADGSARCLQSDGITFITKLPNELETYISTNPQDAALYDAYCNRSNPRNSEAYRIFSVDQVGLQNGADHK